MGYWFKQATKWYYSAVNVLKPRSQSDRVVIGGSADDDGSTQLQVYQSSANSLGLKVNSRGQMSQLVITGGATNPAVVIDESDANLTCALLTSSGGTASAFGLYMKNNQLVFAHVCGANGQVRYLTITLDGLSCAWVQSATAP